MDARYYKVNVCTDREVDLPVNQIIKQFFLLEFIKN